MCKGNGGNGGSLISSLSCCYGVVIDGVWLVWSVLGHAKDSGRITCFLARALWLS